MKKFFIALAFVVTASIGSLYAQLGYQIRWYDVYGVKYEGLLWKNQEDDWEMLVKYNAQGLHIIHESFSEGVYQGMPYLLGYDVRFTCYTRRDARYTVDHIVIGDGVIYAFDTNSQRLSRVGIFDTIYDYPRFRYLYNYKYQCP